MQRTSELFIQNIKNLPIWVKQVIANEVTQDLNVKLKEFTELLQTDKLFQYISPKLTFKGKQELENKNMALSEGYYIFMQDLSDGCDIFEITIKNNWAFADTAKIFLRLDELQFVTLPSTVSNNIPVEVAGFIAGKLKTGEFLRRIDKINVSQLTQAIRYQKELNDEGRHIKMASILIKLGFITDKGLDSLLLLKEEAKKRLTMPLGLTSIKYMSEIDEQDRVTRLEKEISRLENENLIMKKQLKKLMNKE